MRRILLTTVASFAMLASPSAAMTFSYSMMGENKDALAVHMTGEIVSGDAKRFFAFATTLPALPVNVFILNSPGGIISEAGIIGNSISNSHIATAVKHQCSSACFMLFAAGVHRYATPNAAIGIHGASSVYNDAETDSAYVTDVAMARTLKTWGVPDNIVGKLVTTPSRDIYWLNAGDLISMGVIILPDPPAPQAAPSVPSVPLANLPPMFQKGFADRSAWEQWFQSLAFGEYRDGAEYWAGQRSLSPPGSCYGSADFNAGCVEAKERLDPTDRLRKSNPDYKLGWNAFGP